MYAHRSWRGVIGKYGCEQSCPVDMEVILAYKNRYSCEQSERRAIQLYKPIWNTIYNNDPYKFSKRKSWKEENCW